jgi:hypothetical protein
MNAPNWYWPTAKTSGRFAIVKSCDLLSLKVRALCLGSAF